MASNLIANASNLGQHPTPSCQWRKELHRNFEVAAQSVLRLSVCFSAQEEGNARSVACDVRVVGLGS